MGRPVDSIRLAGQGTCFPPDRSGHGQTGGQHQAGTCRMGNDPATSVVDKYCRVHDLDNLYIADGSVLVNNGGFNPVLTIMALAFRTGEHIVKQWTEGGQA